MSRRRSRKRQRAAAGGAVPLTAVRPAATLDLHGLTQEDARTQVRNFVATWQRQGRRAVLRVITGKGLGSADVPVLRLTVERMLEGDLAPLVSRWERDVGGGGFLVQVR